MSFRFSDLKDGEAPAKRARRYRSLKIMLSFVAALSITGVAAIFEMLSLESRFLQISCITILATCWLVCFGLWKQFAPCPRCGWDLYMQKEGYPFMATSIPSMCPGCHLDLEHPYRRETPSA